MNHITLDYETQRKLYEITKYFGEEKQTLKTIEEMTELSTELFHKQNGHNINKRKEELADVLNMCLQLALIYGFNEIQGLMKIKLDRTISANNIQIRG